MRCEGDNCTFNSEYVNHHAFSPHSRNLFGSSVSDVLPRTKKLVNVPSQHVFLSPNADLFGIGLIRGWLIVGKKDMCPQCSEKVDLRRTFANPWETGSLAWAQILDLVRYLVVWQPILLISSQLVLYFMGYH